MLWGTETLPDFEAVAKETAACLPDATLEAIPDAGHGAPLQAQDVFLDRTLSFLRDEDDT